LHKENGLYKSIEKTNSFKIIDQRFVPKKYKSKIKNDEDESEFSYYYSDSSKNSSMFKPENFGSKRK
jgi:hypothetical protein